MKHPIGLFVTTLLTLSVAACGQSGEVGPAKTGHPAQQEYAVAPGGGTDRSWERRPSHRTPDCRGAHRCVK